MAIPNYSNPWMSGYSGNQQNMNTVGNQNTIPLNQNPLVYGNQIPQQNYGSLMTVFVQGESGANAYPVASGNTVLLMDFESGKFWLKSNVNGIPQRLRSFSFAEEIQDQPKPQAQASSTITREEFDRLSGSVAKISDSVSKLIAELGGTSND